jgi:hypothetical protein
MPNHLDYPQELTEDEADMGFRRLEVECLGECFRNSVPAIAIVRILSPSSILVKTRSGYNHLVFGHTNVPTVKHNPIWVAAHDPTDDAARFLHEYELGICKPSILQIQEREFSYKEV